MKASRIIGITALFCALAILASGVWGGMLRGSEKLEAAVAVRSAISMHKRTVEKTVPSAAKKVETVLKGEAAAAKDLQKAASAIIELNAKRASGSIGDEIIDTLRASGADKMADKLLLDLYQAQYDVAIKAVNGQEKKLISALDGISSIYTGAGLEQDLPVFTETKGASFATFEDCSTALDALTERMEALQKQSAQLQDDLQNASAAAAQVSMHDTMGIQTRVLLLLGDGFIGVLFTGCILLLIALVLIFFSGKFASAWKKYPIFSTFIALLVLIVIQVYALGFNFATIGAWFRFWLSNMLNVLRSNSSVGMIALGMTLIIITGGIDLAVGSTLAGVATVVMVLLDVSDGGVLTRLGLTGLPNYLIAITAGLLCGLLIGLINGIGITKGRIPPFIITLGVMNIVRSVAQYFTKGYKTEVPKAFQVIANAEVFGEMLLPILYWLALAVIMYIISKHTAFGRHIFAVGSNERTSRLSGINVDRVKIGVYALMGVIVAIAAVTQVARLRGVDVASAGSGYEMNAIAAVVVGGTSMAGGRGSIEGTVLGVLIIGIMNNLLVLLGIDAFLANAFTGTIIICAVLMQRKEK